jgi:hypothetical protein
MSSDFESQGRGHSIENHHHHSHASSMVSWGNKILDPSVQRNSVHTNATRRLNSSLPVAVHSHSHSHSFAPSHTHSQSHLQELRKARKKRIKLAQKQRSRERKKQTRLPIKFERVLIFCLETSLLFTIAVLLSNFAKQRNIQSGVIVDLLIGITFILFFEDIFKIIKDIVDIRHENSDTDSDSSSSSDSSSESDSSSSSDSDRKSRTRLF